MSRIAVIAAVAAFSGFAAPAQANAAGACGKDAPAALQVLGSAGPLNPEGRASTSYLLWLKGRPALLVDVGPGSTANLAKAGADTRDVDAVLISHLHPDHVSDLPGLLWSMGTVDRSRPLTIVGPTGSGHFPDMATFVTRLFGADGAFPFMQNLLDPKSAFHIEVEVVAPKPGETADVVRFDDVRVRAYAVSHGKAPTLAYRVDGAGFSVVFAGDQNGLDTQFAAFARGADLLVLHTALSPKAAAHPFAKSIGLPQDLGQIAGEAHAGSVLLSHLMAFPADDPAAADFSLSDPAALQRAIQAQYHGPVQLASDLQCIALPSADKAPPVYDTETH